jgi:excisionase family DNA binding protein
MSTPGPAITANAESPLLDFGQARELLGVSRNTLYRLVNRQQIPGAMKLGGQWRFNRKILSDFITGATPPLASRDRIRRAS